MQVKKALPTKAKAWCIKSTQIRAINHVAIHAPRYGGPHRYQDSDSDEKIKREREREREREMDRKKTKSSSSSSCHLASLVSPGIQHRGVTTMCQLLMVHIGHPKDKK